LEIAGIHRRIRDFGISGSRRSSGVGVGPVCPGFDELGQSGILLSVKGLLEGEKAEKGFLIFRGK